MEHFWDDPNRDFRQRYLLPEQFVWNINSLPRIDFDGYTSVVLDLLPPPPAVILDAGCGPGLGTKLLVERGYKVTGIDYSERGIGFARLMVPQAEFVHTDVRQLESQQQLHGQFDAAIHVEVIEHIPPEYHTQVLTGIRYTLRPAGSLVLTVPSVNMPLNKWH
ncbi:MAG TPA: class I SAM-dependent methyltransferase, partial [Caldilineaceae bacterium]|nr:class I SAM-dependent methyltransferase [Caldilineaceae bacterium]